MNLKRFVSILIVSVIVIVNIRASTAKGINLEISIKINSNDQDDLQGLIADDKNNGTNSNGKLIKLLLKTSLNKKEIKCESSTNDSNHEIEIQTDNNTSVFHEKDSSSSSDSANEILSMDSHSVVISSSKSNETTNESGSEIDTTTTTTTTNGNEEKSNEIKDEESTSTTTDSASEEETTSTTTEATTTTETTTTTEETTTTTTTEEPTTTTTEIPTTTTTSTTTTTPIPCPDGFHLINDKFDKCYWISPNKTTWDEGLNQCHALNSSLVSINSHEEFDVLIRVLMDIRENNLWIGGTYDSALEEWYWTDGRKFDLDSSWNCDNQSVLELGNGYCLSLKKENESAEDSVSDIVCNTNTLCSDEFHYVCEIDSFLAH